jgi:hypothetical protein
MRAVCSHSRTFLVTVERGGIDYPSKERKTEMITYGEWAREQRFYDNLRADVSRTLARAAVTVWELYVSEQIDWDTFIACVNSIETLQGE